MTIEEYFQADHQFMSNGGVLGIEQEIGAQDGLALAKEVLEASGYKVYQASADKSSASIFEKLFPEYANDFRIDKPPKIMAARYLKSGMVLADVEREDMGLDPDIFSGMLEAVGNFVHDSFGVVKGNMEDGSGLKKLAYEDYIIQMSRSGEDTLYAIVKGKESKELENDLDNLMALIKRDHSKFLDQWKGSMGDPQISEIFMHIKNSLIDSRNYEGELTSDRLRMEQMKTKDMILKRIESISRSEEGNIVLLLDDAQDIRTLDLELLSLIARTTSVPIIIQYEIDMIDSSISKDLDQFIQDMKIETKYHEITMKLEGVSIDDIVASKLKDIDEKTLEMLQYSAVADEFNSMLLSSIFSISAVDVWSIGKRLEDAGILKGVRFSNSRIKERALESIPVNEQRGVDIQVAGELAKNENSSPMVAELYLKHAEVKEEYREKAVEFSSMAAEQFELATDIGSALGHYLTVIEISQDAELKMKTLEKVIDLEWVTSSRWEDLLTHADLLEEIARSENDIKRQGISCLGRAHVFHEQRNIESGEENLNAAEDLFKSIDDNDHLFSVYNSKGLLLINKKDYDAALNIFEDLLESSHNDLGRYSRTMLNIGLVYDHKKDYDRSEECYIKGLAMCNDAHGDIDHAVSIALSNLSLIYYKREDFEQSMKYAQESLEKSLEIGDVSTAARTLNTIGDIYLFKLENKEMDKAQEAFEQALRYAQRASSYPAEIITLLNLGEMYLIMGNDYLDRSKTTLEKRGLSDSFIGEIVERALAREGVKNLENVLKILDIQDDEDAKALLEKIKANDLNSIV